MKKLLLAFVLLLGITNVASAQRLLGVQQEVQYVESTAKEYQFSHGIMSTPFVADIALIDPSDPTKVIPYYNSENKSNILTVKKIWETIVYHELIVTPAIEPQIPAYKALAVAQVTQNNEADILLGAVVTVTTTEEGKLSVTVGGYPARYVNFRIATTDDLNKIQTASIVSSYARTESSVIESPDLKAVQIKENTKLIK